MIDYKKQGRINLRHGREFEKKVRVDLEKDGWFVSKWQNNVEFKTIESAETIDGYKIIGKMIPAKQGRFRKTSTGFPDFIAIRHVNDERAPVLWNVYCVMGVECKTNGYLSKEEKEKVQWYLSNGTFSKIMIASKDYPEDNINKPPKQRKKKSIKYTEVQ